MTPRFVPGATVYTKDGRTYVVDEVDDGTVYCTAPGGGETVFAEAALLTESEWAGKSDGRRELFYTRLKQSRHYAVPAGKPDAAAAEQLLTKIERLSPGILDFTAFTVATQVIIENGDPSGVSALSIPKCREVFDAARPEARLGLLAGLLGMRTEALADAGRLGDNLARALIDKGLAPHAEDFETFLDRPRR
jgi:hypothetical protein